MSIPAGSTRPRERASTFKRTDDGLVSGTRCIDRPRLTINMSRIATLEPKPAQPEPGEPQSQESTLGRSGLDGQAEIAERQILGDRLRSTAESLNRADHLSDRASVKSDLTVKAAGGDGQAQRRRDR